MCQRNQAHYHNRKRRPSERMKFYRHLRSFVIFNIVMAGLWFFGSDLSDLWGIARIWGVFLAIHYIKVNGLPGTKGWLSKDWEAWMEERESRRQYREDEPETIVEEPQPQRRKAEPLWRDRDLV